MSDTFELPSLEQIQQMEMKRSQAIEALEISDNSVNCQKCRNAIPMMINNNNANSRAKSKRIVTLQTRIKWIEGHYYPSIRNNKNEEIKILKAELADLLKADAEYDKLRNIPLYYFHRRRN